MRRIITPQPSVPPAEASDVSQQRPLLTPEGRKGPLSGAQWQNHEIGDLLGEGGMASVYLARQRDGGRLVALKILPARMVEDDDFRRRFEREAMIARTMDSPHVVKVYSTGRSGTLCYLEMEFVQGRSFGDLCKARREGGAGPYSSREVIGYAVQIARGLAEAGRHKVVHRDIKPGNIMQTVDGTIKIADFGIVKVLGEEALTMTGTAMGTPSYMSPEQGRGGNVDQRADIYSLGVVLYELLALRQPFDGTTADALIYQHHFAEPKPLWEVNSEVEPGLQSVVYTCLQKYADRRYADADALLSDLQLLLDGSPPKLATVSKTRPLTGAAQALARQGGWWRRYIKVIAAALVLLVFSVALCLWWLLSKDLHSTSLRTRLAADLNAQKPIPAGAEADVQRLAKLVGTKDADVQHWQAKIARVTNLQQQLEGLEARHTLSFENIQIINADLKAYQADCGPSAVLVLRMNKRLNDIEREESDAKAKLRELDSSNAITLDVHNSLSALLTSYARYRAASDPDVVRWHAKLVEAEQRIAELRQHLQILDGAAALGVLQQETAAGDLARLTALVGQADEQVIHATARLRASREHLLTLRKTLSQLDGGPITSLVVRDALTKELTEFASLVRSDDQDLVRWKARIAQAEEQSRKLNDELAALSTPTGLSPARLETLQADLEQYRVLSGDNDKAKAWQAQLDEALQEVETAKQIVAALVDKDQLTVEEQTLLHHTSDQLKAVHALDQAQETRIRARLARDEAHLKLLGEQLSVLDRVSDVPETLRAQLDQYERLAGADDQHVRAWRHKLDEITELRRRLAAMDIIGSLPPNADTQVARLIALVGESSADAHRWADKLQEVNDLRSSLAWLNQVGPIQKGAADRLAKLAALISPNDPEVQQWSEKIQRCQQLQERLVGLDTAYVLPEGAAAACDELSKLIGANDPLIAKAHTRITLLEGPPRPAWAKRFARDEHGLYADLAIGKLEQRFRFVPAGEFVMGSPPDETGRSASEQQFHVKLTHSFWIADTECQQELWKLLMTTNPSFSQGEHKPVERISWTEAQRFLIRLAFVSPQSLPCRLPTEAEWEFACRAGTTGAYAATSGHQNNDDLGSIAVYARNSSQDSADVRSRLPNILGLFDMEGNVWEWCMDAYAPYTPVDKVDPLCLHGDTNVIRGGSWNDPAALLRNACRRSLQPDLRSAYVGMRIVVDVDTQKH